jgi:hypothetical protein
MARASPHRDASRTDTDRNDQRQEHGQRQDDDHAMEAGDPGVYREYVLDVRIVEVDDADGEHSDDADVRYRFEAPRHEGRTFENPEMATLYADVYFDVNGFVEAGTGDRGVPPEVIQAGRDTLAAYFLTQPYADRHWVSSFYGKETTYVERYADSVRHRAREIRAGVRERGDSDA